MYTHMYARTSTTTFKYFTKKCDQWMNQHSYQKYVDKGIQKGNQKYFYMMYDILSVTKTVKPV